jgi:hypothetical protein
VTAERDRPARREIIAADPIRDRGPTESSRERIASGAQVVGKSLKRSRLIDKLVLAHRFATGFPDSRLAEKRRTDPPKANANRRNSVKRAAKAGRIPSKKA